MKDLKEVHEDLALFVESGMIAIKQGDEESARKIFNALKLINPEHESVEMGFGLIALHKMDLPMARKHFEKLMNGTKKNWRAQAFLALSHVLGIVKEKSDDLKLKSLKIAYTLAGEVVENCEDPSTKQLAQSVLDWEKEMQMKK